MEDRPLRLILRRPLEPSGRCIASCIVKEMLSRNRSLCSVKLEPVGFFLGPTLTFTFSFLFATVAVTTVEPIFAATASPSDVMERIWGSVDSHAAVRP